MRTLLQRYRDGGLDEDDVLTQLRSLPYEDLDFAKVDHHRAIRSGFPEVILGEGKSPQQVVSIGETLLRHSDRLLVTRASREVSEAVQVAIADATYDEEASDFASAGWEKERTVLVVNAEQFVPLLKQIVAHLPSHADAWPWSSGIRRLKEEARRGAG